MKQGTHETVSQFAGRVEYQLMELQTTFPGAIPQCDEEEIKKGRFIQQSETAFEVCYDILQRNEGKDLTLSSTSQDCSAY